MYKASSSSVPTQKSLQFSQQTAGLSFGERSSSLDPRRLHSPRLSLSGLLLALLAVAIYASNAIFVKLGLQSLDISTFNALRFFMVVPVLFFIRRPAFPLKDYLIIAFCWYVGVFAPMGYALELNFPVGTQMLLTQINVFLAVILSYFMLREPISAKTIVAMLICFAGIFLLTQDAGTSANDAPGGEFHWLGFFLSILGAVSWAIGFVWMKKTPSHGDEFAFATWVSFYAFVMFLFLDVSLLFMGFIGPLQNTSGLLPAIPGESMLSSLYHNFHTVGDYVWKGATSPTTLFSLLFTGIVGTIIVTWVWMKLVQTYSAGAVVPYTFLIPILTLLFAHISFGEAVTTTKVYAAALILFGVTYNYWHTHRSSLRP